MANLKENEKEKARELFFSTGLKQCEIAQRVGVAEKTLSAWAIEGNWRAVKRASFHAPKVEIQRLYEELRVISINISKRKPEQRFPTKEELDARTRILALIKSWEDTKDYWRNIHDDYELTIPSDFNTTPPDYNTPPTEIKTPQTSISH